MESESVLQLVRQLKDTPSIAPVPGVSVRTYAGGEDIAAWLMLREGAFAREKVGVRGWTVRDFEHEFLAKSWWNPQHVWFAEAGGLPVGTVTMALRGAGPRAKPAIHWLAVLPAWRRRGVGRLLVETLERAAWEAGYREVWLETHTQWDRALRLYQSLGYVASGRT